MLDFQLPKSASLKTVAFGINDNEKMVDFYKNIVGLPLIIEENGLSIFGSGTSKTQVLILEETDMLGCATVQFSFCLPCEKEWLAISQRFDKSHYSTKQKAENRVFSVEDPEKNTLELHYQEIESDMEADKTKSDLNAFAHEDEASLIKLAHVNIYTRDVKESLAFYEQIMGFTCTGTNTFSLGHHDVCFRLVEKSCSKNTEKSRWRFFVVDLKEMEEIKRLMVHLQTKEQSFFIDKKKTLLTICDKNGIEWWFTNKKV